MRLSVVIRSERVLFAFGNVDGISNVMMTLESVRLVNNRGIRISGNVPGISKLENISGTSLTED